MVIREYSECDKEKVMDLLVQLQNHLVAVDDENVQVLTTTYRIEYFNTLMNEISANSGRIFVATDYGTVIGLVAGIVEPKDEVDKLTNRCPKRGKILELVVSPNSRTAGVGSSLVNRMEGYFQEQQCEFVCVDVFAPNKDAIRFYQANAYADRNIEMYKKIGEKL